MSLQSDEQRREFWRQQVAQGFVFCPVALCAYGGTKIWPSDHWDLGKRGPMHHRCWLAAGEDAGPAGDGSWAPTQVW